jgi:hypothetical protein
VNLARAQWRKSTRSGPNGCVEVAVVDGNTAVRDSKHPNGAVLVFTPVEWRAFIAGVRDGEFDHYCHILPASAALASETEENLDDRARTSSKGDEPLLESHDLSGFKRFPIEQRVRPPSF